MLINNTSSVENTNELLSPSVRNDNSQQNPYDEFEDQNKIEVDSEGHETFRSPREYSNQIQNNVSKSNSHSTTQNNSNIPRPRKNDLCGDLKLQKNNKSYAHLMPLQMKLSEHILKSSSSLGLRNGYQRDNRTLQKSRSALAQIDKQSSQQRSTMINLRSSKSQRT